MIERVNCCYFSFVFFSFYIIPANVIFTLLEGLERYAEEQTKASQLQIDYRSLRWIWCLKKGKVICYIKQERESKDKNQYHNNVYVISIIVVVITTWNAE